MNLLKSNKENTNKKFKIDYHTEYQDITKEQWKDIVYDGCNSLSLVYHTAEYITQLQQENKRLNDDLEKTKFTLNLIEPEYLKLKKEKQELIEWLKLKLNQSCEEYKESIYKQFLNKLEGKE